MIKILVNGKQNPLGINFGKIRLDLKTELEYTPKQITFNLYNDLDSAKNNQPFFTQTTDKYSIVIDSDKFVEGQRIYLQASLENGLGESEDSQIHYFELGINRRKDQEKWIDNPVFCGYVSEFCKTFNLDKTPDKARLYIVGLGYYESRVNGKKTDEFYFKPLLTDFDNRKDLNNVDYDEENFHNDKKTVCYDTFDILDSLKIGQNQLSVLVGTGWYCNDDKLRTDPSDKFGDPKLFFEIHLYFGDQKTIIQSDNTVLVRNTNRRSQLFKCDHLDFNKKDQDFIPARECTAPSGKLTEPQCAHDAILQKLSPIATTEYKDYVEYDFGKNHSGSALIKIKGEKGAKLTICYYENKNKDGLNSHTSDCPLYDWTTGEGIIVDTLTQRDEYILSGDVDTISPLFHFNCYRYMTISCDKKYEIIELSSLFISMDIEQDGDFNCSNEFINKFYQAYILTQRDNLHSGIISDCPHREKLPYTGDGNLVIDPCLYNFDSENYYRKWLDDIINAQGNNGWVPYTAPNLGGAGGYWWSNVITTLPIKLYKFTGDKSVIEKAFEPCLKFLDFCQSVHNGEYILRKSFIRWYIGEWLNPIQTMIDFHYVNTFAYYESVKNVVKMCEILGETDKKAYYEGELLKIKDAINNTFFDKETNSYCGGIQCANIFPIVYDIFAGDKDKAIADLVKNYKEKGHFDTGIIMTPVLLDFLTENGQEQLAFDLFTVQSRPSFYYMLDGETTLCEHWNKTWPSNVQNEDGTVLDGGGDVSHCHPMFGSVVKWMNKSIAGLDLSRLYADEITIRPRFIGIIESASVSKQTKFGKISVSYQTKNGFSIKIKVPHGITAQVILPFDLIEGAEKLSDGTYKSTLYGGEYEIK